MRAYDQQPPADGAAPPSLGTTVEAVLTAWQALRLHGPYGHETAICWVPGVGQFQLAARTPGDWQLQAVERGNGRLPSWREATTDESAAVREAIACGYAEIRSSPTCSPYRNAAGAGRVLHRATGRALGRP